MRRPGGKGGAGDSACSLPPVVKWAALRAFLTVEALKGNTAAMHLLREMRGKSGEVKA